MDGQNVTPNDLRWLGTQSIKNVTHDVWRIGDTDQFIYVKFQRESLLKARARAFKQWKESQ